MPSSDEVDLIIKDISQTEIRYRLKGGPQSETEMVISLSNFNDVNLKAVREVIFFADTGMTTGYHSLSVQDLKFKQ